MEPVQCCVLSVGLVLCVLFVFVLFVCMCVCLFVSVCVLVGLGGSWEQQNSIKPREEYSTCRKKVFYIGK